MSEPNIGGDCEHGYPSGHRCPECEAPASSPPQQEKRWTADNLWEHVNVNDVGWLPLVGRQAICDAHNATLSEPKSEENAWTPWDKKTQEYYEQLEAELGRLKVKLGNNRIPDAPADNAQAVLQKSPLERLVSNLADPIAWNWTRQGWDERSAADKVLGLMARLGLIQYRQHPLGGHIWEINGRIYGRTDGVAPSVVAGVGEHVIGGSSDEEIAKQTAQLIQEQVVNKHLAVWVHATRFILTAIRKAKSDLEKQDAAIRTLIAATGWCENEGSTFGLVTSVCDGLQSLRKAKSLSEPKESEEEKHD